MRQNPPEVVWFVSYERPEGTRPKYAEPSLSRVLRREVDAKTASHRIGINKKVFKGTVVWEEVDG